MGVTRRPSQVKLVSQVIPVQMLPVIDISASHGLGAEAYGLYDSDGPAITLAGGQGPHRLRHTLVHECIHAMLDVTSLNMTLGPAEEKVVTRLAPVLLSWLRDNPRLVAWLQENE